MESVAATCVLMILVTSVTNSEATISSCSDVIKNLKPCVNYLMSGSGKPPGPCCSGVKALAAAAATSADKKTACNCIKSTSKSLNINSQLAQALPGNCGISLPISVSPNADCSKVG
ncbi:non-specific lipid-transfer protein 8 [Arachis duranensis]|uniref:Non-specific lipid-transfer protein n=1 Tax=Arachis duranensis TaxID=130453 RepID=A0A6P4B1T9_ARADU|nr:non-specific lipid-transfer protein 8 [Arachis duranensis]